MFKLWERWGTALGVLAIILWAIAFALAGNSPSTDDSDAKIVSWYASKSHQNREVIGFFLFLVGVLCLIGFLSAMRGQLEKAEGAGGAVSRLAFGSGLVSATLWLGAVVFFTAPGFAASDTGASDLAPDTYRLFSDAGYQLWISAAVVGAVTVWAVSALALRTGVLPRWFAWIGIVAGVVQLAAVFFVPALAFWVWVLIAGALLTWRRVEVVPARLT
jgi:hypothetical protein